MAIILFEIANNYENHGISKWESCGYPELLNNLSEFSFLATQDPSYYLQYLHPGRMRRWRFQYFLSLHR